ncbi:MAG: hypothetical protein OQJ81_12665, partial [Melioribacteraceae bacterium]|nr:hypothetical protein [Melioribacteraceae bacterium]
MYKFIFLIVYLISNSILVGQLIRNDDFKFKNEYWRWRADGNQNIPTVNNGILHLELVNALDTGYCNTEIYDKTEPYAVGTQVKFRLKCSSLHVGSRGWGLWDGNLSEVLLDYDVAWVMQ